jgi:hypothetical protein
MLADGRLLTDFFRQSIAFETKDDLMVVKVSPDTLFKHGCYPGREIVGRLSSISYPRRSFNLESSFLLGAVGNVNWLPECLLVRQCLHQRKEVRWLLDKSNISCKRVHVNLIVN